MKNKLLFVLFCLLGTKLAAQPTITSVASCTSYTLSASVVGGLPTDIGLYSDDSYSDVIDIGFTFNFYGSTYTQCVIGENGQVSFDLSNAGGFDDWDIEATGSSLLGNPECYNTICGPWVDLYGVANPPYSPVGSPIYTSLQGVAPYRTFAVTWCAVPMFLWGSYCTDQFVTTQIILYETTNIVEVHIGNYVNCPAWDGGYAITGVENASGSAATAAPGEDYPTIWSASNTSWRFTPDTPTYVSYAVSSIPYAPIPYSTATIYWYDSSTGAYIGTGSPIVVTPSVTTTYIAAALGCSDTSKSYVTLGGVSSSGSSDAPVITAITGTEPIYCGAPASVTLYGISPGFIDTIFESINGIPQPEFTATAGVDSTITITNLYAGYYSFYYKINTCPSNIVTDTITNPPVSADFTDVIHLGCNGDSVFITNGSSPSGFTSYWDFGDGSAIDSIDNNPVHVYADGATGTGTYTILLTYETTNNPACISTYTQTVTFNHPLVPSYTISQDTVCLGIPITFTNTSIANSPTYLWNFGDGSTDVTMSPTHTFGAGGVYDVVLTVTDNTPCSATVTQSVDIVAVDVHTGVHDTSVCLTDSMLLHAYTTVTGAIDSIGYSWTPTNNIGEPTDSVTNFMGIGNYTYLVTATTYPLGCYASDTETIHSYAPVTFTGVTASTTITAGSNIHLNADGAVYYTWTPDDGTLNNPNINDPIARPVDSVTTYVVHGMNLFGCIDSASVTITLAYGTPEYVPSAFSPNHDGKNDVFKVGNMQSSKLVDFRVFNRWGQVIFQTANVEEGWDGTFNGVPQDIGTYNYLIILAHSDGTQQTMTGNVVLIR